MRLRSVLLLVCVLAIPAIAIADHGPPVPQIPGVPADVPLAETGDVRLIDNVQTLGRAGLAAPFGETGSFERDGRRYLLVSNTTYGFAVLDTTDPLHPDVVSEYAGSGACPEALAEAAAANSLGPLDPAQGFENDISATPDGRIVVLGMDAGGRCHDPLDGGLEFVDLTDVTNPRTLALTRNPGLAHSVGIDPKRPWLAWVATSDSRDFVDVVDFRSCLGGVAEIDTCRPEVARTPFDARTWPQLGKPGDKDPITTGCHDVRFRGDRAYCAAVNTTLILDTSKMVGPDGRLTGTKLTDNDGCPVIDAVRAPGVKITDCMIWTQAQFIAAKAQPMDMPLVSWIKHDGSKPADQDIAIAHQAEVIADGTTMLITDERGGGYANQNGCPGGGIWFYDIRDETKPKLMKKADGGLGVFITEFAPPPPVSRSSSCTSHYGQEYADENLLTFAWYNAGTRVFRYTLDLTTTPATIGFEEVASTVPAGTMAIQSWTAGRNPADPDELIVYVSDAVRGLDVLGVRSPKVTRTQAIKRASATAEAKPAAKATTKPVVVKGVRKELPATGVGSFASVGLLLLLAGVGAASSLHRR